MLLTSSGTSGVKNNFKATTDPTISDDDTQGYSVGSRWINTTLMDTVWTLLNAATGNAFWQALTRDIDGGSFFDTYIDLADVDGGTF